MWRGGISINLLLLIAEPGDTTRGSDVARVTVFGETKKRPLKDRSCMKCRTILLTVFTKQICLFPYHWRSHKFVMVGWSTAASQKGGMGCHQRIILKSFKMRFGILQWTFAVVWFEIFGVRSVILEECVRILKNVWWFLSSIWYRFRK